jgi:hypothetical protein
MSAFLSGQNNCSQGETVKQNILQEGANDRGENPLEEEYPFTLDLIYHRRQPRAAALVSLLVPGFGGLGQLLLGQESKAGFLLSIEWLIILSFGYFSKALPYILLSFHLFTALDAWVIAGRVKNGQTPKKWEWFWKRHPKR